MISAALPRTLRRPAPFGPVDSWSEFSIRRISEIRSHVKLILIAMARRGYTMSDAFAVQLSVAEALVNAIRHGNRHDPDKVATLRFRVHADRVVVEVEDEGYGYNPDAIGQYRSWRGEQDTVGRGLELIYSYAHRVERHNRGRMIRLERDRTVVSGQ